MSCYCHNCKKYFHYLGISRHIAMHRDRLEDCKVTYSNGKVGYHIFSEYKVKRAEFIGSLKELNMEKVEVKCNACNNFFIVETEAPELPDCWCVCPRCDSEDNHFITDRYLEE